MELEQLTKLILTVSKSDCTSFSYEEGNLKIKIKKGKKAAVSETCVSIEQSGGETAGEDQFIRAPLVGTFYAAAKEGDEPLVKEGDTVRKGQVVGIVEAMKLMNEIESDMDGTVAEVLVENRAMVEYGQPLFRIVQTGAQGA